MYPEVEKYLVAVEAARTKREVAFAAAYEEFRAASAAAGAEDHTPKPCARCTWLRESGAQAQEKESEAINAAWNAYDATQTAALSVLTESATDPLVRWIVQNCLKDHPEESIIVLRALPAPMEELDELAHERGWCEAWDFYRGYAAEAGVLPTATTAESEVSA